MTATYSEIDYDIIDYDLIDYDLISLYLDDSNDTDYCDMCRKSDCVYKITPIHKELDGVITVEDKCHYCRGCVYLSEDNTSYIYSMQDINDLLRDDSNLMFLLEI